LGVLRPRTPSERTPVGRERWPRQRKDPKRVKGRSPLDRRGVNGRSGLKRKRSGGERTAVHGRVPWSSGERKKKPGRKRPGRLRFPQGDGGKKSVYVVILREKKDARIQGNLGLSRRTGDQGWASPAVSATETQLGRAEFYLGTTCAPNCTLCGIKDQRSGEGWKASGKACHLRLRK